MRGNFTLSIVFILRLKWFQKKCVCIFAIGVKLYLLFDVLYDCFPRSTKVNHVAHMNPNPFTRRVERALHIENLFNFLTCKCSICRGGLSVPPSECFDVYCYHLISGNGGWKLHSSCGCHFVSSFFVACFCFSSLDFTNITRSIIIVNRSLSIQKAIKKERWLASLFSLDENVLHDLLSFLVDTIQNKTMLYKASNFFSVLLAKATIVDNCYYKHVINHIFEHLGLHWLT